MGNRPTATIVPNDADTRILVQDSLGDVLIARLTAPSQAHHRAVPTLLEGLALWHREPLRVVLCADYEPWLGNLGLTDGFGFGVDTLHYEVEVVQAREHRRRRRRLRGLGGFGELRRQLDRCP